MQDLNPKSRRWGVLPWPVSKWGFKVYVYESEEEARKQLNLAQMDINAVLVYSDEPDEWLVEKG